MAVRLMPSGVFEFDSVAEAVEFSRIRDSAGSNSHKPSRDKSPPPAAPSPAPKAYLAALAAHQENIIDALREGPLTSEALSQKSGVSVAQLGPTLRHLRDKAAAYGLDPEQIVIREQRSHNGGKIAKYQLGAELAEEGTKEE